MERRLSCLTKRTDLPTTACLPSCCWREVFIVKEDGGSRSNHSIFPTWSEFFIKTVSLNHNIYAKECTSYKFTA